MNSEEFLEDDEWIEVYGAKVHNLKNIDICIPRNKLVVFTGISGSGKSSLAFDTIFAEGQRRYMETFSAYARQFIGNMERPDVEKINGLSPVISIEQKTTNKNPRSTVGTTTEIYDFLRLLFARAGEAYSYASGKKMVKYTEQKITTLVSEEYRNKEVMILSPVVKGRKGHYKELFEKFRKKGFLYARIDGKLTELKYNLSVDRYKAHNIEILIDRCPVGTDGDKRLRESLGLALKLGDGLMMLVEQDSGEERYFSKFLMCQDTGISYFDPAPHHFSFNSPNGACPVCNGLGYISTADTGRIIPDTSKSIVKGAIVPIGPQRSSMIFWQMEAIASKYNFSLNDPVSEIPEAGLNEILYGSGDPIRIHNSSLGSSNYFVSYNGIVDIINNSSDDDQPRTKQKWAGQYIKRMKCDECKGFRLRKESLHFRVGGKNIAELSSMDLSKLYEWFGEIEGKLSDKQIAISKEIIKEIKTRLRFLLDVGVDYLSLNRSSRSLSGGESQRIRLATQIGTELVNVLYILDEPSIGLHHRDNLKLINSLKKLRDNRNSIIVVEHDRETIMAADYIVDIGPGAGRCGGKITASGTLEKVLKKDTITTRYLTGKNKIEVPAERRQGNGKYLVLAGAAGHNLKNIDVAFPLGKLICVTGVSGSGKSSLVNDTLHPILSKQFYGSLRDPLPYKDLEGIQYVNKVVEVDQSPIGRTPRSNPSTYTSVFSDIRKLFEMLPESMVRGYKAGRFSFNVKGGRCEGCRGAGIKTIEMNFLPDVYVKCDDCNGNRYNRETLEVRYKGKSISDVLDMTINQAVEFFAAVPHILQKVKVLQDVGLGYVRLGQPSTTLSGGESQRIKLAAELGKRDTGDTLYILDEPTTGLHFEDIRVFLNVINRLVDKGNTVIIIEHNMDVIKLADHIIDLGPEGGSKGGEVICTGTPEEIVKNRKSYTAQYLGKEL